MEFPFFFLKENFMNSTNSYCIESLAYFARAKLHAFINGSTQEGQILASCAENYAAMAARCAFRNNECDPVMFDNSHLKAAYSKAYLDEQQCSLVAN
jgi:hypothetical protein